MQCELCQRQVAGSCPKCGVACCADHARTFCFRCATAISAVERSPGNTSIVAANQEPHFSGKGYLQCTEEGRPTIHLEDAGPPACYRCGALARRVCRNCHSLYCADHSGGSDLCESCGRSSLLGLAILGGIFLLVAFFVFWGWLQGRL